MTDTDRHGLDGEVMDALEAPGRWLPPASAAAALGISERTLWRHVNTGRYPRRTVNRKAEVFVPDSAPDTLAVRGAVPPTALAMPDTAILAVLDELKRQHQDALDRLTRQAEELGAARAERDEARKRSERLRERLGGLEGEHRRDGAHWEQRLEELGAVGLDLRRATHERDAARAEASALADERDRLVADLADAEGRLAELAGRPWWRRIWC